MFRWTAVLVSASILIAVLRPVTAGAQGNFEIQVYGSETVPAGQTMVELHSNSAIRGTTRVEDGVLPSQYAVYETLEITHGWTSWFETPACATASFVVRLLSDTDPGVFGLLTAVADGPHGRRGHGQLLRSTAYRRMPRMRYGWRL